ncbi:hypothetical protein CO051_03585 [Candidatus Roizmanbacteria bacterium CG_4_9_14_0_2_um_filter_39_13]|uniref:Carbohydrate kinase PfkB domain-containing protein n=2 Tax=Candidatus Roizmaniibacteriota TaxID=1752723 RepID=A0A2M8EZ12_9BACT|nr:MAG: hypothetical protein COY15_01245 [Candidatus Roizmanbacteria bacterium CG_4_10_14_0_2_um_filter_39_12]PJC31977.1 MAG: hypothetical protein CO051_03585 [Candidatus Roizmanbacteria bacterium CG_4_9_14_0_2_um_filter_39_13]PJE61926.1 MAG: hypothetical protein COU87_02005 [Candidatus Roizmanbacteria bacterium CG10_big_fil_rev_8_21_14_0_10_39_12]
MLDLMCFGTVSIDLYYKGESLTESGGRFELAIGGKYYVDHFYEGLGGGGANVAIGVAHAGLHAGLIAKIGNNLFKSIIYKKLDDEHIVHEEFCSIEEDYTNISSILLNTKGEKTIVNYRTPDQQLLKCEDDYDKIEKAESIYMANLANVSWEERLKILQFAKSRGKKVFANLNVTDCRRPLVEIISFIENIDVLIINGYEYADIVKSSYESIDFQSNIIEKFMPFTKNHLLVITNGKKGSYAYHDSKVYYQKAIVTTKVLDTTGAGDAFTAGFIASYIQTSDIQKSMKAGAEYAVRIIARLGAN